MSFSLEKIAASFMGKSGEYGASTPEVPFAQVADRRLVEVQMSSFELVPETVRIMFDDDPSRQNQITAATTEGDYLNGIVGYKKPVRDGDGQALEGVLGGSVDPSQLLSGDGSTGAANLPDNVISLDSRRVQESPPEVTEPAHNSEENVAYLIKKAREHAEPGGGVNMEEHTDPNALEVVHDAKAA